MGSWLNLIYCPARLKAKNNLLNSYGMLPNAISQRLLIIRTKSLLLPSVQRCYFTSDFSNHPIFQIVYRFLWKFEKNAIPLYSTLSTVFHFLFYMDKCNDLEQSSKKGTHNAALHNQKSSEIRQQKSLMQLNKQVKDIYR